MIDLLIDAPFLACPSEDLEDEEFNERFLIFVTALTDLSRFRRSLSSTRIWREASLASTLYTINAYPFKHALAKAMPRLDPALGFQLEDISSLASALLSKSNCINEFSNLEDVVIDDCSITDDPVPNRGPELTEYLFRFAEFALCHLGSSGILPNSVKITSPTPNEENASSTLRYRLDMASYRDGSMQCPGMIRKIELSCFSGNELTLRDLDSAEIWSKGDDASLMDAFAIFAAKQGDISCNQLSDFKKKIKIGRSFATSCRDFGFLHEPTKIRRLVSACVDISIGRNLGQSHWLRRGAGPTEEQKTRGGGSFAWRHDIDNEFHLHYWKNGTSIEFANVVVHNDFSITE